MKISNTVKYGLLAAAQVAKNSKDGLVTTLSVSKECGIPELYLTKVMQFLVRANILTSKRGPRGGHALARPAKEISLLEIIEAIDGPLELKMDITQYTKHEPFVENVQTILDDATAKANNILNKAKLSKMIE